MARGVLRCQRRVRRLELPEDVVAEGDRVREVTETAAVLGETGHRQRARDRPEREHELLVPDLERAVDRLDRDRLPLDVERVIPPTISSA